MTAAATLRCRCPSSPLRRCGPSTIEKTAATVVPSVVLSRTVKTQGLGGRRRYFTP